MTRASLLVTGVLTAVAFALAAAVWVMYADLSRLRGDERAGQEALTAARLVAPDMLSYDYRTIEQDFARAAGYTTGSLTEHYRRLAADWAPSAKEQRTVRQVTVTGAAVESAEPSRVEVLLFTDTNTVKSPEGEEPQHQISQNRARLLMVKKDARWLVAELSTLLGDPPPA
ncbi:hypothetical protein [Streptosporangium sp. NBC_01756]|uniref:hypothetical protein n=1 Tax=Streptosporangium sp. NBC_01756 TaxID=2975950 RepID=UPI002DDBBE36|nr:hypothetical protein [Streptosporangium sp. NBC_01756]WSC83486.1 hypothetical protein OIE48_24090 [Streptosporangium sp. NBC_01756]